MIANTNRTFGNKNKVQQNYLFLLGWLFGIVNGGTRFIWGLLMDKFGFKILMFIISIIEMGIAGSIFFIVDYSIIYLIENLLVACCLSGTLTTLAPLFNKIFGKKYGAEIYGFTGIFEGIASFCGPILIKFIIPKSEKESFDKNDPSIKNYLYLYIAGGVLCLIKFIVLLFFKEDEEYQFRYQRVEVNFADYKKDPINS